MEFCTDTRGYCLAIDARDTFAIQAGGRSGTPTIEIPVINGNIVKVTVQFIAQNPSSGGFNYHVVATSSDAKQLISRAPSICSGNTGWQTCQRDEYFLVTLPPNTGQEDATFEVNFGESGGAVNANAGSYIIAAQIIGSSTITT